MSKSRSIVGLFLALFYVAGGTILGAAVGLGFSGLAFVTEMGIFFLGLYIFPVLGFFLGIFYAVSVLKNDRT